MTYDDTEQLVLDVESDDRRLLREALDEADGFLSVAGLERERKQARRVRNALDRTRPDEPVVLGARDAARAMAALRAYRGVLLDTREVERAAAVEATVRRLADQHSLLARLAETDPRGNLGGPEP